MKSMTGYGHSVYQREDYIIECEMKGYNNRYLDIVHNISPALSPYESYIDDEIKKVVSRGRVELSLKLRIIKSHAELIIDDGLLEDYKAAYSRIAEITGTSPLLSDYLALDGILTVNMVSGGDYKEGVEKVLSEALSSFLAMRISDGQGTLSDLQRLGDKFESSLKRIEDNADRLENHFSELLTRKYEELTGEKADSSAFMTELGALLVKYSINEELSRLGVHIAEYRRLLSLDEPGGKKLDFLCQEMQRECNTIASKSQLADINLLVVSMKDDIENIREQIRNIE